MGMKGRILGLAFCLAAAGAGTAFADTSANLPQEAVQKIIEEPDRRIEQVYLNMPEIFVYGTGFAPEDVKSGAGYLSQDKLELADVSVFSDSGEGICYYVLLDISGSIPKAYFRTIKEGIQSLQDSLGPKDRLVLCTFGEDVVLVADGTQTPEEMASILEKLNNQDQKTLLFEGIDRVAALSEQRKPEDCRRKALFVISDGEDISVGKKQAQEAQNTLKEKGIPAYAFCIKDTATANINNFGEFARTSGGYLVTFTPDQAAKMLSGLAMDLQDDLCVEYRAETNVATNKEESFGLKFADGSVLTRSVMNVHWIPDTEAPYLISGEAAGSQQIRLKFSEPVVGLDGAANYQVSLDGASVGVTSVSFDKLNKTVVSLFLEEPVQNGTYEISCANITDCSMEKNPLTGSARVVIDNAKEPEAASVQPAAEEVDHTGVLFLIFMAVVALIIIFLVKNRKKPADESKEPIPPVSGAENMSRVLHVTTSMEGMQAKQAVWKLESSLTIGRSSKCNVRFDDPEMSRCHFSLEPERNEIYIKDLNSLNGTTVNGIRILGRQKLEPGAVIEAGSMKITVRW